MSERIKSGFIRLAAACAAISTAGAVHGQTVIYVDDDAPGGGDGFSWDAALSDLQDALWVSRILSESIEIRIAGGTYLPSQTQERYKAFDLSPTGTMSGITLHVRGGFRGLAGGGNPNDRDLNQFVTILSGDLNGDDLPDFVNYGENSRQIVELSLYQTLRDLTILDGVMIRGATRTGLVSYTRDGAEFRIANCILRENLGTEGGGARMHGQFEMANCMFLGNRATWGGAVHVSSAFDSASLVSCNFIGNRGWEDGAAIYSETSVPIIRNSIFVDNGPNQRVIGQVDMAYSILPEFFPGEGNLIGDPLFVDPSAGDYQLAADSPCIDAGDTRYTTLTGAIDLLGHPRVVDDPVAVKSGVGDYGYIDMGTFEYQGCEGDLNNDGLVNSHDLLAFLNRLAEGCR